MIYVNTVRELAATVNIHGIAHITGGGLVENLPRVLPDKACAYVKKDSWPRPEIFTWLQKHGNVSEQEMLRTFNCGIGMVLCIPEKDCQVALDLLNRSSEGAYLIGTIGERSASGAAVDIS